MLLNPVSLHTQNLALNEEQASLDVSVTKLLPRAPFMLQVTGYDYLRQRHSVYTDNIESVPLEGLGFVRGASVSLKALEGSRRKVHTLCSELMPGPVWQSEAGVPQKVLVGCRM